MDVTFLPSQIPSYDQTRIPASEVLTRLSPFVPSYPTRMLWYRWEFLVPLQARKFPSATFLESFSVKYPCFSLLHSHFPRPDADRSHSFPVFLCMCSVWAKKKRERERDDNELEVAFWGYTPPVTVSCHREMPSYLNLQFPFPDRLLFYS